MLAVHPDPMITFRVSLTYSYNMAAAVQRSMVRRPLPSHKHIRLNPTPTQSIDLFIYEWVTMWANTKSAYLERQTIRIPAFCPALYNGIW